jgi:uncharacterized membrane protein YeaQ/YmgE (transglycosylase-associated protein family)
VPHRGTSKESAAALDERVPASHALAAWRMRCIYKRGWKGGPSMGVLGWIVFGLIVGALAKFIMPGRDGGGLIVTTLLGIVGALVGGFLGRALGLYSQNEPAGFLGALVGAVIVLAIFRMASGRRALA